MEGKKYIGRPCSRWLEGVKKACGTRSLELEDGNSRVNS